MSIIFKANGVLDLTVETAHPDGSLSKSIRDAYSKYGFFIFEGALNQDELEDIKIDLEDLRSKFPTGPESSVNSKGEPAMNAESKSFSWLASGANSPERMRLL